MNTCLKTTALALGLLAAAAPLRAQHVEGGVSVQHLTYRFHDESSSDRQTGIFLGAQGSVQFGVVRLGLSGMTGQLNGGDGLLPVRNLRSTAADVGFSLAPTFEVGVEAQARHESTDSTAVLQRFAGAFGRFTPMFGDNLQGTAELAYFPVTSATTPDPIHTALRAEVGVRFAPATAPVVLSLGYRIFRIDHGTTGGVTRLEQDESLVLAIGLHR